MVANQPRNNVCFDTGRHKIKLGRDLAQQVFPRCGHLTHKVNGLRLEVVLYQIAAYKTAETFGNEVAHVGMAGPFGQEIAHRGQIIVRQGFVIHLLHHLGWRGIVLVQEVDHQLFGCQSFKHVRQERLSHSRPAAFVAKDEPTRMHVLHDIFAVVKARIAACIKDAGNAGLV